MPDRIERTVLSYDCVSSLRDIDVRKTGVPARDQNDRRLAVVSVVAEPLETVIDVVDADGNELRVTSELVLVP